MPPLAMVRAKRSYKATVVDLHDGDTATVDIRVAASRRADQYIGFGVSAHDGHLVVRVKIRLYGINAPELATPEGVTARDYLTSLIAVGGPVTVVPYEAGGHTATEKYGRTLADIWPSGSAVSINESMVASGNAIAYFGGPR